MRHDIWAGGRGKPGVAGWRLKPARKGSEQRSASQGKAFPFIKNIRLVKDGCLNFYGLF